MAKQEVEVTMTTKLEVTPELLGRWFAKMDSKGQADFFVAAAEEGKSWGSCHGDMQWHYIGGELRDLGDDGAMEVIRNIAYSMDQSKKVQSVRSFDEETIKPKEMIAISDVFPEDLCE